MKEQINSQSFRRLAQSRNIKLVDNQRAIQNLLHLVAEKVRLSLIESQIESVCQDPFQRNKLLSLLLEMQDNPSVLKNNSQRFLGDQQIIYNFERRRTMIDRALTEKNHNRENIFQKYYKKQALSQSSDTKQDTMLVMATSFKVKKLYQIKRQKHTFSKYPLQMINNNIDKFQYSYCFIINYQGEFQDLLIQYDNPQVSASIQIKNFKTYIKRFQKVGIIILDFTEGTDFQVIRNTSILFCIGGLYPLFLNKQLVRRKTYQWLVLLYQESFSLSQSQFTQATNFQPILILFKKQIKKDVHYDGYNQKISRIYAYLLMMLLNRRQQIIPLYINQKNLLISKLRFPLLQESEYVNSIHIVQFQKIYRQLCWRYSLKVDKSIQLKAKMSKNAIFSQQPKESLKMIKLLFQYHLPILASFSQKELTKAIITNEYISVGAILHIFSKVFIQIRKRKQKHKFSNLLLILFEQILLKLQKNQDNRFQIDRQQKWNQQITRYVLEQIISKQNTVEFIKKQSWAPFYIILKKLWKQEQNLKKLGLDIIQKQLVSNLQNQQLSPRMIESLSMQPINNWDTKIAQTAVLPKHIQSKDLQNILNQRFSNSRIFNKKLFDELFCKMIQSYFKISMDFDTIATILNALDKINLKLSQLKNEKIFIQILNLLNFQGMGIRKRSEITSLILRIIQMKSDLQEITLSKIKQKLIICKETFIREMVAELKVHLSAKNRHFIAYLQTFLKKPKFQEEKDDFFQILCSGKKVNQIQKFKFDEQNFKELVKSTNKKIISHDFTSNQLQLLFVNKTKIRAELGQFGQYIEQNITSQHKMLCSFKQKISQARNLLSRFQKFIPENLVLQEFEGSIENTKVSKVYSMQKIQNKQIQQFIQVSSNFQRLILPSSFWSVQKEKIFDKIDQFKRKFEEISSKMKGQLTRFRQDKSYNYNEYLKLISNKPIQQWCKIVFKEELKQIQSLIQLLKNNNLAFLNEVIQAILSFPNQKDNNLQRNNIFNNFTNIYRQVERQQPVQIKLIQATITSLLAKLQIQFKMNNSNYIFKDQKVKIVCFVSKNFNMLKQIKELNITPQVILNLKQYINSDVYSGLQNQLLLNFEQVVLFVKSIYGKKLVNLVLYLKDQQKKEKKLKSLYQSLQTCLRNFEKIKEKLKQAQSRQTSFKDEIEYIFSKQNKLTWIISLDNQRNQLSFNLNLENNLSKSQKLKRINSFTSLNNIDMQKLKSLKQNCLMFKAQSQKDTANKYFAQLLLKYLQFYKIITNIQLMCEKLMELGSNPKNLIQSLAIQNQTNDPFSNLVAYEKKVVRNLESWRKKLIENYQASYLLTFFKGQAIQELIISICNCKIPKIIVNEFKFQQNEFLSVYKNPILAQKLKQIQNIQQDEYRIEFVREFLVSFQQNNLGSTNKKSQMNKVSMIVTSQYKDMYHFFMEKDITLHQIFFCIEETTPLQLEIFILRSLRQRTKKYFIVGAQWLKIEVKNQLQRIVLDYYKKDNLNRNNRTLCFIDSNSSDKFYSKLAWSNQLKVKQQKNQDINLENFDKLIGQKYFGGVQLVTSAKPGLGKTYYAQRKTFNDGKKLIYFPICGNIDLKSLFERMKSNQITQKHNLIFQLGYFSPQEQRTKYNVMMNMRKLQIFLTETILFRKFYFEGRYTNIPSETTIFIEIENLLESALFKQNIHQNKQKIITQKYQIHLLNLLDKFNSKHYICRFELDKIQFDANNLKDIFVYKNLQLLESKGISSKNLLFDDLQPQITHEGFKKLNELLFSEQFFNFYTQISNNSEHSIKNHLQNKIRNYTSIGNEVTHQVVKQFLKFSFNQWKSQYFIAKNNNDIKKSRKLLNFQAFLVKIQKKINSYEQPDYPPNKLKLIQKYFKNRHEREITYRTYRYFMDTLFDKINTFSKSSYLRPEQFEYANQYQYLKKTEMTKIRENFMSQLITNTSQLLQQTTVTEIKQSKNQFDHARLISETTIIILNAKQKDCYQFVYKKNQKVQFPIKTLLASQNYEYAKLTNQYNYNFENIKSDIDDFFKKDSIDLLTGEKQENKFMQILYSVSQNKKFLGSLQQIRSKVTGFKDYRLTKDNFFKICYILQKAASNIPVIIMGQSGVGKTALIKFLVNQVLEQPLEICNVHAGIHQQQFAKIVQKVKKQANQNKNQRFWVFFDEYNTSDSLSLIKQIVIDRRFLGEELPKNIIFCTACNPYRLRLNSKERAFYVKPPNLSMVAFMWDYEQLKSQQCKDYCKKMLKHIIPQQSYRVIDTIIGLHKIIKQKYEISFASLRDVARFKQLYFWFKQKLPPLQFLNQNKYQKYKQRLTVEFRSLYLSYYFAYIVKIPDQRLKEKMIELIQEKFVLGDIFLKLIRCEQTDFTFKLKQQNSKIAFNLALRQNLFTLLVCILNKIPVLLIGAPGTSKSLSIKLISSNLRGKFAQNQFCRRFPELLFHFFQGSQSSTSEGIIKLFDVTNRQKPLNTQYCILFDEIGLAGKSVHNPLKVMHSKIETHNKDIAIIAISNQQLDSAKMSRFLTVSREETQIDQLIDTAEEIYQAYFPNDKSKLSFVIKAARNYHQFVTQQKDKLKKFYGMRDFYSMIKYICNRLKKDMNENDQKILHQAIKINFDVRKSKDSQRFLELAGVKSKYQQQSIVEIIKKNISDPQSRYLLFVIQDNSIFHQIGRKIFKISDKQLKIKCMYGSPFEIDNCSEQYNIEITSKIISEASKGEIIGLKDLNNSIQTSFYDLFNKSYLTLGKKKYCRVAVGDKSNPRCYINPQFSVIMFVDKNKLQNLNSAFLNRFQKHTIGIKDWLTYKQKNMLGQLQNWIESIQKLWKKMKIKNKQNYLLNISEQSLASLVCKYQQLDIMKQKIIQNSTSEFYLIIKEVCQKDALVQQILQIKEKINRKMVNANTYNLLKWQENDAVIFTYNTCDEIMKENDMNKEKVSYLKIIQNELELKKTIIQELINKETSILQINSNFQKDKQYLDYLLYLVKSIKKERVQYSGKRVRVVIQVNRYLLLNYRNEKQYKTLPFKINVSYLHQFEQFFYDNTIDNILQSKNKYQFFKQTFNQNNLHECFVSAVNYFQIICDDNTREAKDYLSQIYKLYDNRQFCIYTENFNRQFLQKTQIQYKQIFVENKQLQKEEKIRINSSNNLKEMLRKKIEPQVVNMYKTIIQNLVNTQLFYLIKNKNVIDQKQSQQCQFIKEVFMHFNSQNQREKIFKQNFQDFKKDYNKDKQIERNLVFAQTKYLFPYSYLSMKYIFHDDKSRNLNTIEFFSKNMFFTPKNLKENNPAKSRISLQGVYFQTQFNNRILQFQNIKQIERIKYGQAQYEHFIILLDIIRKLLGLIDMRQEKVVQITYLYWAIKKLKMDIINLIIILTVNRQYWKIIFEILQQLIKYCTLQQLHNNIAGFLQKNSRNPSKIQNLREQLVMNSFEVFIRAVLNAVAQIVTIKTCKVLKSEFVYSCQYFLKKINNLIDLSSHRKDFQIKLEISFPNKKIVQLELVELFGFLNSKYETKFFQQYVAKTKGDFSYYLISEFCQQMLLECEKNSKQKEREISTSRIINYLGNLFSYFGKQLDQIETQTKMKMLEKCQQLANKYVGFANLLLPLKFFPHLFKEQEQAQKQQKSIKNYFIALKGMKNFGFKQSNKIGNFDISLGLYFRKLLLQVFYYQHSSQYTEQDLQNPQFDYALMNLEENQELYLQCLEQQELTKLAKLFKYEFMKTYLQFYIESIFFRKRIPIERQWKIRQGINNYLKMNTSNLLLNHLRIYLLKYIYHRYKYQQKQNFESVMSRIRQKSEEELYSWLAICINIIKQDKNKNKYYLPIQIHNGNQAFLAFFKEVRKDNFPKQKVRQLLQKGLQSPQNTYYLLTILSTLFYTEQIAGTCMKQELNRMEEYNKPENKIVKKFILNYLKGEIVLNQIKFDQKRIAQYQSFLPMLNFLNLVLSYRIVQSCFIEMFFQKGQPLKNVEEYFKDKYIFGTLNNPQLVRFYEFFKQQKMNQTIFVKCQSHSCLYIFGHKQCQDSIQKSSIPLINQRFCQLCKTAIHQQNKCLINCQQLLSDLQNKKIFTDIMQNVQYKLKGLQVIQASDSFEYYRKKQVLENVALQSKQRTSKLLASNVLEMIIYFVWYVLSEINQKGRSFFSSNSNRQKNKGLWKKYYSELQTRISIPQNKLKLKFWLYGVNSILREQLNQSYLKKQKSTLSDQFAKFQFSSKFEKKISKIGLKEQRFINENKHPSFLNKEDIIIQQGLIKDHKKQLQQIELFQLKQSSKFQSLKEFHLRYLERLQRTYPALYQILKSIQEINEFYMHLKVIYVFVYRIWLVFNFELKRCHEKKPIGQILNMQNMKQQDRKKLQVKLKQFYKSWNYFAEQNSQLQKYQNTDFNFSEFILDSKKSSQQSKMFKFISDKSEKYNSICKKMQQKIKQQYYNNKQKRVLNSFKVNPTYLSSEKQFWPLSCDRVQKLLKKNRYYSLTYGQIKYQFEFQQIQNCLIKELYSAHYLMKSSAFKRFYFIQDDQQLYLDQSLKSMNQQLSQADKVAIKNLYQQDKNRKDQFIESLTYSLKKIINYLRYFKPNPEDKIDQFLERQQKDYKTTASRIQSQNEVQSDNEGITSHPLREIDVLIKKNPIKFLPINKIISLLKFIENLQVKQTKSVEKGRDAPKTRPTKGTNRLKQNN